MNFFAPFEHAWEPGCSSHSALISNHDFISCSNLSKGAPSAVSHFDSIFLNFLGFLLPTYLVISQRVCFQELRAPVLVLLPPSSSSCILSHMLTTSKSRHVCQSPRVQSFHLLCNSFIAWDGCQLTLSPGFRAHSVIELCRDNVALTHFLACRWVAFVHSLSGDLHFEDACLFPLGFSFSVVPYDKATDQTGKDCPNPHHVWVWQLLVAGLKQELSTVSVKMVELVVALKNTEYSSKVLAAAA